MAKLLIRFKKKRDGTNTLTCVRADGSITGQRQEDSGVFVLHDLSHYAVEATLGLRGAFYGLLARGWDIDDFGSPWPRGPIPPDCAADAGLAECFAGAMDMERYCGIPVEAEAFNRQMDAAWEETGSPFPRRLSEEDLSRVRATLEALTARWKALLPGRPWNSVFPATEFRVNPIYILY